MSCKWFTTASLIVISWYRGHAAIFINALMQPCTLTPVLHPSSCKDLLVCKGWKCRRWTQALLSIQVECLFLPWNIKGLSRWTWDLKAILYELFFTSLTFLSLLVQKHRTTCAGRNYRGYLVQPPAQGPTSDQVAQDLIQLRSEQKSKDLEINYAPDSGDG